MTTDIAQIRWPEDAKKRPYTHGRLPREFCQEVLGYLARGDFLEVVDSPYNGTATNRALTRVLYQEPRDFRRACAAGCIKRANQAIEKAGIGKNAAKKHPTIRALRTMAREIRRGTDYVHYPVGEFDGVLIPKKGEEKSMYSL